MRRLTEYGPSLIVLLTALLVLFTGPTAVRVLQFAQTSAQIVQASDRLENPDNILAQISQATRDVAAAVEPSVVHISVTHAADGKRYRSSSVSSGSGWIYDEAGHIVTNYHVVEDATRIEVQLHTGELRKAEIVGYDEYTDIAVIVVDAGRLHPAILGDLNDAVEQGDLVFAFGSPFDFRFSMSRGVVSGIGRSVGVIRNRSGQGYENFIQVDAAINPGNSGGPLTNYRGHVIGMNTAIATGPRGNAGSNDGQFAGIGLAIPLNMIVPVVDQLISDGIVRKGYLGLTPGDINRRLAEALQTRGFIGRGVLVRRVEPNTPAERAGLEHDDIITHINDQPVESHSQLRSMISSMLPGSTIDLRIWRYDEGEERGMTMTLPVTLERLSTLRVFGRIPDDQPADRLVEAGIASMDTARRSLTSSMNVNYTPGVIIRQLTADSRYGDEMPPGSIITEVAGVTINSVEKFFEELRQHNLAAGRGVPLTVIRPDGSVATPRLFVR